MRNLPYQARSFGAVICMWSSFCHLLTQKDQIAAITHMHRVLKQNGQIGLRQGFVPQAIIDLPYFNQPNKKLHSTGTFETKHIFKRTLFGLQTKMFLHTKETLTRVMKKTKINYTLKYKNIGKRRRLILTLFS